MAPRRYLAAADLEIRNFNIGDMLKLKKVGFDEELDQTVWEIERTQ